MVFQSYNLWPHMTVYDNLAFGLKIRGRKKEEIRAAVDKALQLVRLPNTQQKMPGQLSGGQQQRIAVARSLLLEPAVLLLDEPFSALDAKLRLEMREELRDIQASTGLTMVFVTHDQEEALSISDRIVVMNAGKIEQMDSPQRIYDHPETLFVAQFIGRMNFLPGNAEGTVVHIGGRSFPVEQQLSGMITAAIRPEDIAIIPEGEAGNQPAFRALIRQVMILGHYAEVTAETEAGAVKLFVPREQAASLQIGKTVSIGFTRVTAYAG
jgi:putative spermidine/putrescine transport system ATP-binding protein